MYVLSYFFQSLLYTPLFAETPTAKTHLVAVFVDKDIYKWLESDIKWYASQYIQSHISSSKAIVLPIDTKWFAAKDITAMLENMYFDWVQGQSSDLVWAVFLWNIPLPVVEQDGFVYPSIYPYVDFENQQFIYDANKNYFVYNNVPNGQPEIWHGLINFWTDTSAYSKYFGKLRDYVKSPSTYVAPRFWYDDIIGMKSTFSQETLPLYVNNFVFTEDVGYHRFTNTMVDYFKNVVNAGMWDIVKWLTDSANSPELTNAFSGGLSNLWNSTIPTVMLSSVLKELVKWYDSLYPGVFLSQMRDNTEAASRWYKNTSDWSIVDAVDSHISKTSLKDSWVLGNVGSWVSPLLINYNNQLESALDDQIVTNQRALKVPVLDTYNQATYHNEYAVKTFLGNFYPYCSTDQEDSYQNYYFGKKVSDIKDPQEFSIYRGTYRNATWLQNQTVYSGDLTRSKLWFSQSLGSSYWVFDTQIEANRGYNIYSAPRENDVYSGNKKPLYISAICTNWEKFLWWNLYCKSYTFNVDDTSKTESPSQFAQRNRWGASALNLDTTWLAQATPQYKLLNYNYLNSQSSIYDLGGATATTWAHSTALSVAAVSDYASIIKIKTREGDLNYPLFIKWLDLPGYVDAGDYKMFQWDKVRSSYAGFDYLTQYYSTNNKGNTISKTINLPNNISTSRKSGPWWWACWNNNRYAQEYSYSYLIFSSIIKNVAPSVDQINGSLQSPFTGDWLFIKHYDFFSQWFSNLYNQFNVVNDSDTNLNKMNVLVNWFYSAAKTLSWTNINNPAALLASSDAILASGSDFETNLGGLNDVVSMFYQVPDKTWANGLIQNMSDYFAYMTQAEQLNWKKTQFLQSWIDALSNQKTLITNVASTFSTKYSSLNTKYTSLKNADYWVSILQTKRSQINTLHPCGSGPSSYTWTYATVCQKLDTTIETLSGYIQSIVALSNQQIDTGVVINPFADPDLIKQFSDTSWIASLNTLFTTLTTRVGPWLTAEPAPTLVTGFNQVTKDRPIDSDRNTTFKWLWWDIVKFSYPNLYDVNVYSTVSGSLLLKTPAEIEKALTLYLLNKSTEYNNILTAQEKNRVSYYVKYKDAFDLLAKSDPLASPNNRTTQLLPSNYFVDKLKDQIPQIAELLYYQSLPSYLRVAESNVSKDLSNIRSSFDVNKKISYVMSGYLTKHDDLGPITTPWYLWSGYEVAYINSDWNDYIAQGSVPSLISDIQQRQLNYVSAATSNVAIEEADYTKNINECGLDANYSTDIFKVQTSPFSVSSPWVDSLKCWWKNIPTNTRFSIKFAIWPSPAEFVANLTEMFDTWQNSMKKAFWVPTPVFSGKIADYWANITQPVNVVDENSITKVDFKFPTTTSVPAWTQIPFNLVATDKDGKQISASAVAYHIKVDTWNGLFVDGNFSSTDTVPFTDFESLFLYQAPQVTSSQMITMYLFQWDKQIGTKTINVEPSNLTISSNNTKLYANNKVLKWLQFTLKNSTDVPTLQISLSTLSGRPLDTAVTVVSQKWLIIPGVTAGSWFQASDSFLITKWNLSITLMPNFVAGDDTISIKIPGQDPIFFPIHIVAWTPSKVNLKLSDKIVKAWDSFTGTISVTDDWWNILSWVLVDIKSIWSVSLNTPNKTIAISNSCTFTGVANEPGGTSYVYAIISGVSLWWQSPWYQQITVQKPFLPENNLNVMYLNLFGTDWWNQRAYWSSHKNYASNLITNSPKLLAVTTELIDPSTLKKFVFVVGQDWQLHPFADINASLSFASGSLVADVPSLADITMTSNTVVNVSNLSSFSDFKASNVDHPNFFVLQDDSDPTITTTSTSILSGDQVLIDTQNQILWTGVSISLDTQMKQWYSIWDVNLDGNKIATLLFVLPWTTSLNSLWITLLAPQENWIQTTFADGSTNGHQWLWIYTSNAIYEKKWYVSIEDSSDYRLGIWFLNDFKNMTLFGDGQTVGESTVPYASSFLVNYGDPLLKRISDNKELPQVPLDSWLGNEIYSDPSKTVFKVLSADINNDGFKDLVIVLTDWTVKILKNYGWTNPYRDIQELFRLVDNITDVQVGDVDNNGYPDLIVRTDRDQLRVYTNDRWVFDVDGKLVCLNTNAQDGQISINPSSVAWIKLFFEDMDKDNVLDIVSSDGIGDVKIFYGWLTNWKPNYVSTLAYTCDADWYTRQKNSTTVVKRFGLTIDPSAYIQDQSMLHIQGWNISSDNNTSTTDTDYSKATLPANSPDFLSSLQNMTKTSTFSAGDLMGGMTSYLQTAANQSLLNTLQVSPVADFTPMYESAVNHDTVWYKTLIALSGDQNISVYKQYQDLNGWILMSGDEVKITTTFLWLSNNIRASYIDRLSWPWQVPVDDQGQITTWKVDYWSYSTGNISRWYWDNIQYVMDNILLSKWNRLVVSYTVRYVGQQSPMNISIKSIDHPAPAFSPADIYPDILLSPQDACKKYRWDFMNTPNLFHRTYEEVLDTSMQDAVSKYVSQWETQWNDILKNAIPGTPDAWSLSTGSAENFQNTITSFVNSALWGINLGEQWSFADLFNGDQKSISLDLGFVDKALAPAMKYVDDISNGLCKWFKIGQWWCQPPVPFNMIPFNQAFLAPGEYHLFGCTPQLPNPLAPVFAFINKMLWAGLPILYFPGTFYTPVGPIPMVGSSLIPTIPWLGVSKWLGDGFGIPGTLFSLENPIGYPSWVRLYLVPTLTLQMWVAMCFGPYGIWANIPKLLRDLGGNCVVTAFPLLGSCSSTSATWTWGSLNTEVLPTWMTDLAAQWSCVNPAQGGKTIVYLPSALTMVNTISSPIQLSSRGASSSSWVQQFPSWNFGGMWVISFNEIPTKISPSDYASSSTSSSSDFQFPGLTFTQWPWVDLNIVGANAKWIIEVFVKDWLGRQTQYLLNNLTKMTISVTLPNVTDLVKWFWSFDEANKQVKALSTPFTTSKSVLGTGTNIVNTIAGLWSTKNYTAASDLVNNPFDSLVNMFQNVPLIRLQTKDIIINVPMVTSENILKYTNYLKTWLNNQARILRTWVEAVWDTVFACVNITKDEARQELTDVEQERILLQTTTLNIPQAQKTQLLAALDKYKVVLNDVVNGRIVTMKPDFTQDLTKAWEEVKNQFGLFWNKLIILPVNQFGLQILKNKQSTEGKLSAQDTVLMSRLTNWLNGLSKCSDFAWNMPSFTKFFSQASMLVSNVQQNIQVLEQYKKFPTQLSNWMNGADAYLSDITTFISHTVGVLMNWMTTNAKIYSKYVDALILIVSSIKTWQILIDFSVNRSQKCGKCSRDSYGSYSCGLSFILDKVKSLLPILPIPPFKIPNIYIDLSHIDLGMTVQLPRFRFVPMNISLPKIPDLPSPPSVSLNANIDLNVITSLFDNLNIPTIPVLPGPPTLPELPAFIPQIDFSLPTLPPAPKIPNIIPSISTTLNFASSLAKIFCIVKWGIWLVGEKWVKAKVEQLTQRTWDVKAFDFFNQTVTWKKDPVLKGFDFKMDGYLQFRMNFDTFYGFLNQVAWWINTFTSNIQNSVNTSISTISNQANQAVTDYANENIKDINLNVKVKTDINIDPSFLKTSFVDTGVEYSVAATELKKWLAYMDANITDPQIKQKIKTVRSVVDNTITITPTNKELLAVQKQITSVLSSKQKEIKLLANSMNNYTKFLWQVDRQDAVLVDDTSIDKTYSVPLFATDDATRTLLATQENPYKLALDTNAWLVTRYLNTINASTADDLGVDKLTYDNTKSYLSSLSAKVDQVYSTLDLQPIKYNSCGLPIASDDLIAKSDTTAKSDVSKQVLLAQANPSNNTTPSAALSADSSYDLSPYVRGVFVPKQTTTSGTQMINVVKSDSYIEKIWNNYQVFSGNASQDLNKDGVVDVLSWDSHGVYVKYGHQQVVPKTPPPTQSYDSTYYTYNYGWSWYMTNYNAVLNMVYPDGDWYIPFTNNTSIRLVHPYPEVKNFSVKAQNFDYVQFSWTTSKALWYEPAAYLVKLNHRIDTFTDKDKLFDLWLNQDLLHKSFVLFLPKWTDYSKAILNVWEKWYSADGRVFNQANLVRQFLSGGAYSWAILAVKYYDPDQETISTSLSEIPRNRQYAEISALKNIGSTDAQKYVLWSPWSNQIVIWRQLLADTVGPSSTISLYRPSIQKIVSQWSDHKWYVWTTYSLQANWKDNIAVAKMWIQQWDTIIAMKTGMQETWFIELSGLYFTGNTSLDFTFGAQDFQWNQQLDPVRLTIETPDLSIKSVDLTWSSGQVVAQLSHDIDEWLVTFQRQRNQIRQEITWSLSNSLWWFSLQPLQTILTGWVFSLGQDIGFYDNQNHQIWSVTPDGNMTIFPTYQALYKIVLDLSSTLPALRVLDIKNSDTLFWVHLPPKQLVKTVLGKQAPLYQKADLIGTTFGWFNGWMCVKNSSQQCMIYVSSLGEIYIPQQFAWSLRGSYIYDTINKTVVYTLRDVLDTDQDPYILQATVQVNLLH